MSDLTYWVHYPDLVKVPEISKFQDALLLLEYMIFPVVLLQYMTFPVVF